MSKSPERVFLQFLVSKNPIKFNCNDIPVDSVQQLDLVAMCLVDLERPRLVVAGVHTTDDVVVSAAVDVVHGNAEGDLVIAVDTDVEEVGDGDGLGSGKAGKKCGDGELHFVGVLV